MQLENQVVSLELAKKLKELGVKQESLFVWYQSNHSIMKADAGKKFWYCAHRDNSSTWKTEKISAFTVAELGEMLPKGMWSGKQNTGEIVCWNQTVQITTQEDLEFIATTEADARAKMLIYLIENKLIKL